MAKISVFLTPSGMMSVSIASTMGVVLSTHSSVELFLWGKIRDSHAEQMHNRVLGCHCMVGYVSLFSA